MLKGMNALLPTFSCCTCPTTRYLRNEVASMSGESQPVPITATPLWPPLCSVGEMGVYVLGSCYISQILQM